MFMKHKLIFSKLVFIIYFFYEFFKLIKKITTYAKLLGLPKLPLKRSKQTFTDLIISADVQGDG